MSLALFAFTDAVSVLVIMGCACCKQKKSAKAAVATSAAVDITDLSPSNPDGGLSAALTQGRYCPDPTQTIPDFNKGFSSSVIFPSINTHQRPGCLTSTTMCVCVCVCVCLSVCVVLFSVLLMLLHCYAVQNSNPYSSTFKTCDGKCVFTSFNTFSRRMFK